jgi:hypothetical protein
VHNKSDCTYRGREGFPSSRLRLSISDRKYVDVFSGPLQACWRLWHGTMGTSDYQSDRLSAMPRQSAANTRRDWCAFIGVRTIGNNRSGRQVHLARHRALGSASGGGQSNAAFCLLLGRWCGERYMYSVQYMYVMSFTLESIMMR